METVLAFLVGGLVAASVYQLLRRNVIRLLFGLMLLTNATNLVIFTSGRLTRGTPALIPPGMDALDGPAANALPQALILTAIVIGFGLLTFTLILAFRAYQATGTEDTDAMRLAEPPEAPIAPEIPAERREAA